MEKYKDVPMDFADAMLVALAEEAEVDEVFTLSFIVMAILKGYDILIREEKIA